MTTTQMTVEQKEQVARPLRVLVSLIKQELQKAKNAASIAAAPFYEVIGVLLDEARESFKGPSGRREWLSWVFRNFGWRENQAERYLSVGQEKRKNPSLQRYDSLADFEKRHLGKRVPNTVRAPAFLDSVRDDALAMQRENISRVEEREAQRKLALQLIDIGYRILSTKLHPDKGGSRGAMARLNQVRDRLKTHA